MSDFSRQSWQDALLNDTALQIDVDSEADPAKEKTFRVSPRLLFACSIIFTQLGLALFGSWVWQQDPDVQNLSQVLQSPDYQFLQHTKATLLDLDERWNPTPLDATQEPAIKISEASSERVRLQWSGIQDATEYRLYRRSSDLKSDNFGLPIGATEHSYYEDQLALTAPSYQYTVIAEDAAGDRLHVYHVSVKLKAAIDIGQWRLNSPPGDRPAKAGVGDSVILPAHPLGTDHLGRDMLARLIAGARTSLFIGIVAPLLAVVIGCGYGALSGLLGGNTDLWMMRFAEFVIALPFLLFMVLFKVVLGAGTGFLGSGVMAMIVAMVMLNWATTARLVRGQVLQLRELNYVKNARLLGADYGYLLRRYIVPNLQGLLVVEFSFAIPAAIFTEAFLSFIGLGVSPPTASWGVMCQQGMRTLFTHPHELLLPAMMLSLTVLAFNLLGDALRDQLQRNEVRL